MAAADRGLLRNRAFLAIWGAQILSQVAANAVTSALIILVAEITHSNTSSSVLILLAVLPAILFGSAGGVIVDRSDRRLVLIITNALRAAAIVPLLLFGTSLTVVYLVNFLVATVTIFFVPAEAALLPKIVGNRYLMVANSLFTFTFNGAFLVGFIILAPIIVSLFGYEVLWVTIAFMFAAASILCETLPKAPPASEHLSRRVAEMAVAQTATGITEAFPVFVAVVAGTAFVFGVSYALITVPAMTLLQEELPDEIRGRVFGFLNMLVSIFSLVPLVIVGPIADLWGVAPVFVGFAGIVAVVWIGGKSTRDMRRGKAKLVTE